MKIKFADFDRKMESVGQALSSFSGSVVNELGNIQREIVAITPSTKPGLLQDVTTGGQRTLANWTAMLFVPGFDKDEFLAAALSVVTSANWSSIDKISRTDINKIIRIYNQGMYPWS